MHHPCPLLKKGGETSIEMSIVLGDLKVLPLPRTQRRPYFRRAAVLEVVCYVASERAGGSFREPGRTGLLH